MPVICVGGVAGVGKSTIIDEARDRLEAEEYNVYSVGTFMFEEAERRGLVEDRDQMRFLDESVQDQLKDYAVGQLIERSEAGENIVLDSHYVIPTPDGYLPGLPDEDLERIGVDAYVLLFADPQVISERRVSDPSRQRDMDPLDEIARDQYRESEKAHDVAARTNVPLYVIDTTHDNPSGYGERLSAVIDDIDERTGYDGDGPEVYNLC